MVHLKNVKTNAATLALSQILSQILSLDLILAKESLVAAVME